LLAGDRDDHDALMMGGEARVLVVEDSLPSRDMVVEVLQGEGFDVIPAGDGRCLVANDVKAGVLVTDIVLPG
jgi:CheY-like chemotaxis protein